MNVLITGATGLVGTYLAGFLQRQGHSLRLLSRQPKYNPSMPSYRWDVAAGYIDPAALADAECIIHLAGEGIADKRWTAARKKAIRESRTASCALLAKALASHPNRVHTVIGASAVGYYGDSGDQILDETSPPGHDFMAATCVDWEAAYEPILGMGIRCPRIRIGVVLSPKGGALAKMVGPYKFGLAPYLGDGQQYMPWIHIHDLARVFLLALEDPQLTDIYNAVSPNPAQNREFAQALGKALGRNGLGIPAPRFALRLLLGEMAAVVLNSNRVVPKRLQALGFEFLYPELLPALQQLFGREKAKI